MITYLNGIVKKKAPTELIVEVQGIGYAVNISLSTYELIPEINQPIHILTYVQIREDAHLLYGFATENEREVFKLLISVSGIGPRLAQTILSGMKPNDLLQTIIQGSVASLTAIPGIGKKTAERLIVELRDKAGKLEPISATEKSQTLSLRSEAVTALISLGFSREKAEQAIRSVLNESKEKNLSIEEIIKGALKLSGK
ncbi:MAG: Holliday junction branch migration protein RuvA [Bacteroidetes bacterium]|nr:Holliday junction branch migration protein RuvA [Bacteroidota bacterium]